MQSWFRNRVSFILYIAALAAAMSFKNATNDRLGSVNIAFRHYVGDSVLMLDDKTYYNSLGQSFKVGNFKYYISNIRLRQKDGSEFVSKEFFLVNEAEEVSKSVLLNNVPAGDYTSLTFTLGVDSLHNCSGAQSGALDPVNAMFWAWNTGYIFFKLEGKSAASTSPGKIFEFHIGGYKQPYNCIRTITIDMSNNILRVQASDKTTLQLKADIAKVFNSTSAIDISTTSSITEPKSSKVIADNYVHMFSVIK